MNCENADSYEKGKLHIMCETLMIGRVECIILDLKNVKIIELIPGTNL